MLKEGVRVWVWVRVKIRFSDRDAYATKHLGTKKVRVRNV